MRNRGTPNQSPSNASLGGLAGWLRMSEKDISPGVPVAEMEWICPWPMALGRSPCPSFFVIKDGVTFIIFL